MDKKPDYIDDDAWIMVVGYSAIPYGDKAAKMANGLLEVLKSQGYTIVKTNGIKRRFMKAFRGKSEGTLLPVVRKKINIALESVIGHDHL